jgi:hypothetical protein
MVLNLRPAASCIAQVCDSSQQRALAKTSGSADAQIRALRNKVRLHSVCRGDTKEGGHLVALWYLKSECTQIFGSWPYDGWKTEW